MNCIKSPKFFFNFFKLLGNVINNHIERLVFSFFYRFSFTFYVNSSNNCKANMLSVLSFVTVFQQKHLGLAIHH